MFLNSDWPKPKLLISYRYSYICHHKALVHFIFPFLIFFLQFLLASSWDKHVRLYDVVNNNLRVKYAHQHPVLCCAFQVRTVCRLQLFFRATYYLPETLEERPKRKSKSKHPQWAMVGPRTALDMNI